MLDSESENQHSKLEIADRSSTKTAPESRHHKDVLPGYSSKNIAFKFQSDPARLFIFLVVLHSGFDSVSDLTTYIRSKNEELLPVLNSVLLDMETSGIIQINGDEILHEPVLKSVSVEFADPDLFQDLAGITIRDSFEKARLGESSEQVQTGFRYFVLPNNKRLIGKYNALWEKFKADVNALGSEQVDVEKPEFMYVSVSRGLLKPEDF